MVGFSVLVVVATMFLFFLFLDKRRILTPYVLGSLVVLGWVTPQLFGIISSGLVDLNYIGIFSLFVTSCLFACLLGFESFSLKSGNVDSSRVYFLDVRLLQCLAVFFVSIGIFSYFSMRGLAENSGTEWSGMITIHAFFTKFMLAGFAVSIVGYYRTKKKIFLFLLFICFLYYFDRVVVHGRRSSMVEVAFLYLLIKIIILKELPSLKIVISGFILLAVFVTVAGDYRYIILGDTYLRGTFGIASGVIGRAADVSILESFYSIFQGDRYDREVYNAILAIEYVNRNGLYDFGAFNWNTFIFSFIPAQLVGADLKYSLLIDVNSFLTDSFLLGNIHTGTTFTGFADSYSSFGIFGAVKFFIISFVLKIFMTFARSGSIFHFVALVFLFPAFCLSFTHHTSVFFNNLFFIFVFIYLPWFIFGFVLKKLY